MHCIYTYIYTYRFVHISAHIISIYILVRHLLVFLCCEVIGLTGLSFLTVFFCSVARTWGLARTILPKLMEWLLR